MNHGRINHKPDEATYQRQCLKRYITNMRQPLRREFVKRLENRHGADWVQAVRDA